MVYKKRPPNSFEPKNFIIFKTFIGKGKFQC